LALINVKNREVQIKIVYYGPGRGGKTTNLEFINKKYRKQIKTEMVSLKTQDDRTLFLIFYHLMSVRSKVLMLPYNCILFQGR